jgi:hypothetical protein
VPSRIRRGKDWTLPGGGWGLFGYHAIPADAKEIVVTEGEYDAMAGKVVLFEIFVPCVANLCWNVGH